MTIAMPEVKSPLFLRLYRVPSYTEAKPGEAEALETLAQLVGGDPTSTLYRELVVIRKLASDAGASYDGYTRDAAEFSVYAVPRPGVRMDVLEQAVDAVLKSYAISAPRTVDMERAKTQLVAEATYQRDSQYALASAYGQALAIGLTVDDVEEWPDRIRAVAALTVKQVATADIIKREAVTGYLVPGPRQ
jgi:zinc protease